MRLPELGAPVRSGVQRGRLWSAALRPLPDFVVLGAQRAGTTALYRWLSEHPQVLPAAQKEVHYFSVRHRLGLDWYRSQFPTRAALRHRGGALGRRAQTGEASPYYLFHPHAPDRLARSLPQARLLVLLRDPVARAWSHYHHNRRLGIEARSFRAALAIEMRCLPAAEAQLLAHPQRPVPVHQHYSYLHRGLYGQQLARWMAAVAPERVLVQKTEELRTAPGPLWARVQAHLGLDCVPRPQFAPLNQASQGRMDPGLYRELVAWFAPDHRHLAALLGWDPGWH